MVRVLFLHSSPVWNAIAGVHLELMRGFDPKEVEVHVACTTRPPDHGGQSALERISAVPHVKVHPFDYGMSFLGAGDGARKELMETAPRLPGNLLRLAALVVKEKIDLIHFPSKQRDALYALPLGALTGRKTVDHMHFMYGEWMGRPLKWALKHSSAVVGVSRFVADSVITRGGVPKERVSWVHNTVTASEWDPGLDGSAVRRELGIPPGAPVIGIVARLIEWKGHAELIDAVAGLKAEFPEVRLVAVGGEMAFAQGRKGYKQELIERARRQGVEQNVLFLDHRRDVPQLLAAMDVFAFTAWEEGFGLALLEAMAMGRACLAWDNGGPRELVEHGRTGLLVKPKDVPALKEGLETLLRSPELRKRLGDAGREAAVNTFTPQVSSRRLAGLYRQLLAGKPLDQFEG